MRGVRIALAAGLALSVVAVVLTLLGSPLTVAGTNRPIGQPEAAFANTTHGARYCQAPEVLPRGSTAIRLWLGAAYGPRVSVVMSSGGHRITGGEGTSGWSGGSVTIPVKPLRSTFSAVTVCASFRVHDETVLVEGNAVPAALATRVDDRPLGGRMWIEYLHPSSVSWASLAPAVIRHIGFGRAAPGTWVAYVALALFAAITTLVSRALIRELR